MLNTLFSNFVSIIFKFLDWFLGLIFSILPELPQVSPEFEEAFNSFLNILQSGIKLVTFFIPADCIKVCVPVLIFVFLAEPLYFFITWLIRKVTLR